MLKGYKRTVKEERKGTTFGPTISVNLNSQLAQRPVVHEP